MKIAILGSRGIPNHYGGFEQYASQLAVFLVQQGWEVVVFNSSRHPYKEETYRGVRIRHIYDPEISIGTAGAFIYDLACILHTRSEKFDLIYQLGYTSNAIFNFLFPKCTKVVTNMDGMEWKRAKYNKPVRLFIKYSEKIAVRNSDFLIADSMAIHSYLSGKYGKPVFYSSYTATVPSTFNPAVLAHYGLRPKQYLLIISRLEPENNIEMMIKGYLKSKITYPLIIIGRINTKLGRKLQQKYANGRVLFMGAIYDKQLLDNLRYFSCRYLHGHSVGGTNPSLLEAMACSCRILAHKNEFNKEVLEDNALYFQDEAEISAALQIAFTYPFDEMVIRNLERLAAYYSESDVFFNLKNKMMEWVKQES